ncbi:hypothetical protein [Cellulomonas chitinilytica]|uniref:hypothetical protein n=1 Tax=Cellulomonas chitinilytica TaxID=398759 RepID=UPI00194363FC|nr:hypothetical protein [Cellulomonas chitinilytica]
MTEIWGPALDAQVAFHREELARAAGRRPKRARRPRADHPRRASRGATRGWLLRGSGAWHAAR